MIKKVIVLELLSIATVIGSSQASPLAFDTCSRIAQFARLTASARDIGIPAHALTDLLDQNNLGEDTKHRLSELVQIVFTSNRLSDKPPEQVYSEILRACAEQ